MNKKLITLGLVILAVSIIGKLLFSGLSHIKIDDFHPAAVIFVVDSSASNQSKLQDEIKYVKQLCNILDPEDQIKILNVSEKSYLIYEGAPTDSSGITKSFGAFTKYNEKDYGTAYGEGLKKAISHALTMNNEGYTPAIVVIGDLESEGALDKQINWDTLPKNIMSAQKEMPELTMMFLFAHPEKLDFVKEKLGPILGERKLIVANEQVISKTQRKFLEALGR